MKEIRANQVNPFYWVYRDRKIKIMGSVKYLSCGRFNEIHPHIGLPQFMVTPACVCENLNTIQTHFYMRTGKKKDYTIEES